MRPSLRLYEAPLPPRGPWDREASLVFLLTEGQEAPLVLYAEAYGERAMGEVKRALGLPSDYDPAVDGAPGVGFYEEEEPEPPTAGGERGGTFADLVAEAARQAHLVGEVEYALEDLGVWERLSALNRDFALSFARFWEEKLAWEKEAIQGYLSTLEGEIEAYERKANGQVLSERLYPLYWQALEAGGVLRVAKEEERVRLTLPRGLNATLPAEGASPEVVGLLLELGGRVPKRLLASPQLSPHSFRGQELYPYGHLAWDHRRDRPLLEVRVRGEYRNLTFPLAQESPYTVDSYEELRSLNPSAQRVRYVLASFVGREGKPFTKALALPEGEYRLLSPQAQAADPRRYPEVVEAAKEEALQERSGAHLLYTPRDPWALKERALKELEALEGLIEAVASFREQERRKAFPREAPFDAEPDL